MAISLDIESGPYTATAGQKAFPFYFSIASASEIQVLVDGVTIGSSSYSVTFDDVSGTVTFVSPMVGGKIVLIRSNPDFSQVTEFDTQGAYSLKAINANTRRSIIRDAWLRAKTALAVLPVGSIIDALGSASDKAPSQRAVNAKFADLLSGTGSTLVGLLASGTGAVLRTVQDKLREMPTVRDFGAIGNGTANDTAALALAIAAQPFLRWPAGTYMVDSLPSPPAGCDWVADGQVIIKRRAASTANTLVNFTGACQIKGITFDGNKAANSNPCNSVVVTSTTSFFDECKFINAKASGGYGSGFIIDQATASEDADHALWNCYAYGNDADGFAGQNVHGLEAFGNVAYSNSQHGFHFDNLDVTFTKKLFDCRVIGNYAYNNGLDGIYFGNFLATNTTSPPIYGIAGYESYRVVIEANVCRNNGAYGIAAQGYNLLVQGNICNANARTAGYAGGILLNAYYSKADGNVADGNLGFGIDAGGASYSLVSDNMVRGNSGAGINSGGAIAINVKNNTVIDNGGTSGRQIDVYAFETDASGVALPDLSAAAVIQGNTISVTSTNWGIFIQDGCSEPKVIDNVFLGPDPLRYLVMIAKGGVVKNNVCDAGTSRLLAPDGGGKLTVPEIFDFCYTNSATTITSIDYFSANGQVGRTGVAWVAMTSGGSGYTSSFAVTFTGGGGSGATGTAYVRNGSVVGVRMTSYGSGYTSTPTPNFSAGSGTGAAGTAQVGVPLPDFRELEIYTNTACTINRAGNPVVESPAAADLSMTARGAVRLRSTFGRWNVMSRAA